MTAGFLRARGGRGSYGVGAGIFLLRGDDVPASLGSVEGSFTADDGLTLGGATFGFATDFGDGVPVVSHGCGWG